MNQMTVNMHQLSTTETSHAQAGRRLSEAQKTQVTEILKSYDAENLSSDDVLAIREAFKSAKIPPGRDLRSVVEAAGWQMTQLALPEPSSNAGAPRVPEEGAEASTVVASVQWVGSWIDVRA